MSTYHHHARARAMLRCSTIDPASLRRAASICRSAPVRAAGDLLRRDRRRHGTRRFAAYYLVTGENPDPDAFTVVRGMQGWKEALDIPGAGTVRTAVVSGLGNTRSSWRRLPPPQYDFVGTAAHPGGCAGGGGQPIHDGEERMVKNLRMMRESSFLA